MLLLTSRCLITPSTVRTPYNILSCSEDEFVYPYPDWGSQSTTPSCFVVTTLERKKKREPNLVTFFKILQGPFSILLRCVSWQAVAMVTLFSQCFLKSITLSPSSPAVVGLKKAASFSYIFNYSSPYRTFKVVLCRVLL